MITAPGCILPMRIGSLLVHVRSLLRREPLFSVLEVMREVNYDMVETGRKNSSPPPSSAQENSVSVPLPAAFSVRAARHGGRETHSPNKRVKLQT